jgi:hypothetical protein
MGRCTGGNYVSMLKQALKRLASTTCISEGFFYSKPRDLYVIQSFQFITEVQITGDTDFSGKRYEKTVVRLHEFIRENLNRLGDSEAVTEPIQKIDAERKAAEIQFNKVKEKEEEAKALEAENEKLKLKAEEAVLSAKKLEELESRIIELQKPKPSWWQKLWTPGGQAPGS